ncbi:MAG TPA: hypothetical protein VKP78_07265, partial [bacterium]|nr:hypothetical protein [bacterium]
KYLAGHEYWRYSYVLFVDVCPGGVRQNISIPGIHPPEFRHQIIARQPGVCMVQMPLFHFVWVKLLYRKKTALIIALKIIKK